MKLLKKILLTIVTLVEIGKPTIASQGNQPVSVLNQPNSDAETRRQRLLNSAAKVQTQRAQKNSGTLPSISGNTQANLQTNVQPNIQANNVQPGLPAVQVATPTAPTTKLSNIQARLQALRSQKNNG